jgi:hypothetical protein
MDIDEAILGETRSILGAFSGISRVFSDIDQAIDAGDIDRARWLLREIQIAIEATRTAETPYPPVDSSRRLTF